MGFFNFGFFGTPAHRVFNYKPRYYDVEKEALKEKFGHVDGTKEKEYTPGSYIRGGLRDGNYQKNAAPSKLQKILGMISMILVFVMLFLFAKNFQVLIDLLMDL